MITLVKVYTVVIGVDISLCDNVSMVIDLNLDISRVGEVLCMLLDVTMWTFQLSLFRVICRLNVCSLVIRTWVFCIFLLLILSI